jgi:hypothetical protein
MSFTWTQPDPLTIGTSTLSIFITELQQAVNYKREEISQVAVLHVNQSKEKTFLLSAMEELKTQTATLAIDFGYINGINNVELLGRDWSDYEKFNGEYLASYQIISDLRKVLDLLVFSGFPLVLASQGGGTEHWGNFALLDRDNNSLELDNDYVTINSIGGSICMDKHGDSIIESKDGLFLINRTDGTSRQLATLGGTTDICADDTFIYVLETDAGGLIQVSKYFKDGEFVSTIVIQAVAQIQPDSGHFSFDSMAVDEGTIYLTGMKHVIPFAVIFNLNSASAWHNQFVPDDSNDGSLAAICRIPKDLSSFSIDTTVEFIDEGLIGAMTHTTPLSVNKYSGCAVDEDYIYTYYVTDVGWGHLISNPAPFDYQQFSEPVSPVVNEIWIETGGSNYQSPGETEYLSAVRRRLTNNWASATPQSSWLTKSRFIRNWVVRVPKNIGADPDISWKQIATLGGFNSSRRIAIQSDDIYIKVGDDMLVIDKNTSDNVGFPPVAFTPSNPNIASEEQYAITNPETTSPVVGNQSPSPSSFGNPTNSSILIHVTDGESGVDAGSVIMKVNGLEVTPAISGNRNDHIFFYNPVSNFTSGQAVTVSIEGYDNAGNTFSEEYIFNIEL